MKKIPQQRPDEMSKKSTHRVAIISLNGRPIEVDEELAQLIPELNSLGLRTVNSCQGGTKGDEHAYLSFYLDDNSYFDFSPDTRILTFRWNRTDTKFLPISSFIHVKGGIKRIDAQAKEIDKEIEVEEIVVKGIREISYT